MKSIYPELRDNLLLRVENEKPAGFIAFPNAVAITYNQLPAVEYGNDLVTSTKLYLTDAPTARVEHSKRIGVDYAGAWAERLWRFSEVANPYVSKRVNRVK